MTERKASTAPGASEGWGTWEDSERWARQAFQSRSPLDRLAWLENVLELRNAVASAHLEPTTVIKLTSIEPKERYEILLRFSDGASGTFDFAPFVEAGTEMTEPLRDPTFFKRCFIELGALAWPNGFDMSAESLYQRLHDDGKLRHDPKAA